jgi:hypothetical protein
MEEYEIRIVDKLYGKVKIRVISRQFNEIVFILESWHASEGKFTREHRIEIEKG